MLQLEKSISRSNTRDGTRDSSSVFQMGSPKTVADGGLIGRKAEVVVPVLVAARSKAWVCGRSPAGIVGSNPTGGMDVCCCECCQVEVSATG